METKKLPEYEAPEVTTYTDDEILEELGDAQACISPCNGCCGGCGGGNG